jgi:hypothetical protein
MEISIFPLPLSRKVFPAPIKFSDVNPVPITVPAD